jgi:hypothetical protein
MRKRCGRQITQQAYEVLQIWVFLDLQHGFHVRKALFVFDDHGADDQSRVFQRPTSVRRQALIIAFRQFVPWDAFTELDPAVVFIQGRLKAPIEFGNRQLL